MSKKKQKNKELANQQRELALKSKREKMLFKLQKEKEREMKIQYQKATDGLNNWMLRGLDFEAFKKFVWDHNQDKEYAQSIIDNYERDRETLKIPAESLEYVNNVVNDLKENRKNHNIVMYMPCFDILEVKKIGDVGGVVIRSTCDLNYHYVNKLGESKSYYFKNGFIDGLLFADILENKDQAIFVDKTTNEVITKHTQFLEKEVVKVKTETKIVKQEKKVGLTDKEIDKAIEKTRREFKNVDSSYLESILQSIKTNLCSK